MALLLSEPLPQPSRSLVVNGVAVDLAGAGAGRIRQTAGIWKHGVEFIPAVRGKNGVYLPCSVEQSHIFPIIVSCCAPIVVSPHFSTVSHLLYTTR